MYQSDLFMSYAICELDSNGPFHHKHPIIYFLSAMNWRLRYYIAAAKLSLNTVMAASRVDTNDVCDGKLAFDLELFYDYLVLRMANSAWWVL